MDRHSVHPVGAATWAVFQIWLRELYRKPPLQPHPVHPSWASSVSGFCPSEPLVPEIIFLVHCDFVFRVLRRGHVMALIYCACTTT